MRGRRSRRRAVLALLAVGVGVTTAFACGFPDVGFGDDAGAIAPEAGQPDTLRPGEDGGRDAAPGADAYPDADASALIGDANSNLDAPGDEADAIARTDADKPLEQDASCKSANPCDCDNDGYESTACDGGDCNDRDPLLHPKQTYVAEPPTPPNEGNWDCVSPIETQYPYNLRCASLVGCPAAQGFTTNPKCGEEATYYECKAGIPLVGCGAVEIGTRRQGCK